MNSSSMPYGCIPLLIFFAFLFLPFILANVFLAALAKLGLSQQMAFFTAIGIFFGGLINIPVKRIPREQSIEYPRINLFGIDRLMPRFQNRKAYTVIAINVGGCIVPTLLAIYELGRIANQGFGALLLALIAIGINVAVCYKLAKPTPNVGIAMPAFVPAIIAAVCGVVFLYEMAPQIAFTAGVLGPLIGADLFHLKDISKISAGVASIGGAGTFDGIVLSGLVAALLA